MMVDPLSFTCPVCGWTSVHPDDVREGYCGHCHDWTRPARDLYEVAQRVTDGEFGRGAWQDPRKEPHA